MNFNRVHQTKSVAIKHATPLAPKPFARRASRTPISHRALTVFAMALDAAVILVCGALSDIAYNFSAIGNYGNAEHSIAFSSVVAALFIGLTKHSELYTVRELMNFKSQAVGIATKWVGVFFFMTAVGFALKASANFSRGATISFAISGLIFLLASRAAWRLFVADGVARHQFVGRKTFLIAEHTNKAEENLLSTLSRHGIEVVKELILPSFGDLHAQKVAVAEAIASLRGSEIEEIIVSANIAHWAHLSKLLAEFRILPIPVNFIPAGPSSELLKRSSHTIGETVTVEIQRTPRTPMERAAKRTVDVLVASIALVMLLPMFVMTAISIKLDSPGPALFRQKRHGFNGRPFYILKFRTMTVMEDGPTIHAAQPHDSRLTRIGHWLRRSSIDELPQLINVLKGNMSIVGPRPHAAAHDSEFDKLVGNYAFRQHAKPGLTGWAQVHGLRGQMSTVADIKQRVEFDLWYIDNWNFALDFKIMLMTVSELIRGRNAY